MSCRQHSFFSTPSYLLGTLSVWDEHLERAINFFPVYSNAEIYVGRDSRRCNHVVDDPIISNRHLRIYTIIFDRENDEVAPLVYAQDLSMNGTSWNGYPMGKGSGSFLLGHGDVLKLSPAVSLRFHYEIQGKEDCFNMVKMLEMRVFEDQYKVTSQKLGSGGFGQVHMAFRKDTGQQLACKIVDLRDLRNRIVREAEDQRSRYFTENGVSISGNRVLVAHFYDSLQKKIQEKLEVYNREARILECLCHPNIISIEKVIHSSNTIYLFQELVTAGDLFSYIQYKGGRLDDIEAAVVVRQVLMALDYLHQREIVHRDLKPDNILMTSLADGCRVVLTDFGCARLLQPTAERMFTITGTFDYNAPEMFKYSTQGYTKAVDLWSLGCVTAVLLTGDIPFKNSLTADPTGLARRNDFEKLEADLDWNKTGQRARDFVHKLLVFDEAKRMDVSQSLNHSWFTNPAHRGEFEALYQRAIRHWRPRTHEGPLIANLCTLSKSPKHSSEFRQTPRSDGCSRADSDQSYNEQQLISQEGTSSISPALIDYDLRREHSASLSTTLSDPELPPHRWIGSIESVCSLMDTPDSVQHEQGFIRNTPIQNMQFTKSTGK